MTGREEHIEGLPIIQYWHSAEAPDYIAALFETFSDLNPDRPHLIFNEASAAAFIAEHFESRRLRAFLACAVPAMQADYFRYCAVLKLGGAYVDADSRCISNLDSLLPAVGCGRLFQRPKGPVVNGGFAFGSPGHAFLALVLDIATANVEGRDSDLIYATTGPLIFTNLCRLHRLGSFDAFIEHMTGRRHEDSARRLCETIGDYALVSRALVGITISPISENMWVSTAAGPLPYKENAHWMKVKGGIFSNDAPA